MRQLDKKDMYQSVTNPTVPKAAVKLGARVYDTVPKYYYEILLLCEHLTLDYSNDDQFASTVRQIAAIVSKQQKQEELMARLITSLTVDHMKKIDPNCNGTII